MKTSSEGFQQSYNAQIAVEGENQLVVAAAVTDNASDQGQLVPMVDAVAQTCGETPEQVLAVTGHPRFHRSGHLKLHTSKGGRQRR